MHSDCCKCSRLLQPHWGRDLSWDCSGVTVGWTPVGPACVWNWEWVKLPVNARTNTIVVFPTATATEHSHNITTCHTPLSNHWRLLAVHLFCWIKMCVCFFKDLGSSDLRKDVYVVAHIIRIGKRYWMHHYPEFSKKHHAFCVCVNHWVSFNTCVMSSCLSDVLCMASVSGIVLWWYLLYMSITVSTVHCMFPPFSLLCRGHICVTCWEFVLLCGLWGLYYLCVVEYEFFCL